MTTLDPAYCADGCGRLAETERPMGVAADGDYIAELVCNRCAHTSAHLPEHDGATCPYPDDFCTHECVCHVPGLTCLLHPLGEHSSNPREDG